MELQAIASRHCFYQKDSQASAQILHDKLRSKTGVRSRQDDRELLGMLATRPCFSHLASFLQECRQQKIPCQDKNAEKDSPRQGPGCPQYFRAEVKAPALTSHPGRGLGVRSIIQYDESATFIKGHSMKMGFS